MKIKTLLIAAALAATPVFADDSDSSTVIARPAEQSPGIADSRFGRGATRKDVIWHLGEPPDRLSRDVWIYWDYRSNQPSENAKGRDTLVLIFANNRVVDMQIVNRSVVEQLFLRWKSTVAFGAPK